MNKRKVLMLGWNDASMRHSGVGVACRGLCEALARTVQITLIVPSAGETPDHKAVQLLTTEEADDNRYSQQRGQHGDAKRAAEEQVHETVELPIDLDPYYFTRQDNTLVRVLRSQQTRQSSEQAAPSAGQPSEKRVEQDDVLERVMEYARRVSEIAHNLDFDIIHAHDWMTFLAGIHVKNQSGKPLVLHVHSLDYDRTGTGNKTWIFNIERFALSKADMVISVSDYTSGIIFSRYGLSSRKVVTIHNGVEQVSPFRLPSDQSVKTVLFVGRITGQKGPKYFLQVALRVAQMYNDVRFVMVGVGDAVEEIMQSEAFGQLEGRIELKGFLSQEELHRVYAASDVLCLPSVSEPFGLVALEALQFGVPVVLSNRAGVGEILESALKANYWDIDLMANHVVALMTDGKLRKLKVDQGLRELKHASWKRAAAKVNVLYNNLLEH